MDIKENFRFQSTSQDAKGKDVKQGYLSIYWKCCHVFSRIGKNRKGDAYEGHCPRCRGFLRVAIGEGGTQQRGFIAH